MGYLSFRPDAEGQPVVSTLNAVDGALTSNMAIVPTLNGSIDAYVQNPADLVLDIFSYFAPIGPLNITTTSLPSGTLNYQYSVSLGASGGVPPYTWSTTVGSLPPGLNLVSVPPDWVISGTPTTVGTYPFTLQVADSQTPPATAPAPLSITVNATLTQLTLLTTSLPAGTQNTAYSAMLAADGGVTPYTWSITAGSLPIGLHLDANSGAITGTPSGAGISNFTVQVTDSNSPPATATAQLSITIVAAVPLRITTASLPYGIFGTPYGATLTAAGGVYPYTWSITAGSLPAGLSLKGSTGAITGTPTGGGASIFTVQVADSESPPQTATAQLSISIAHGIIISSLSPNTLFCDPSLCLTTPPETFDGSGFTPNTLIYGSGYPGGEPLGSTYPDQWIAAINISGQYYRPRFIDFWMTSADGSIRSNDVTLAFFGSAPIADASANNIFVENPADGNIYKFNIDGSFVTSFGGGAGRFKDDGIAVDDFTGR